MVRAKKVDGYKCGKCGNLFTGYDGFKKASDCCKVSDEPKIYYGTEFVDKHYKNKTHAERTLNFVAFKLEREDAYFKILKNNPKINKDDISCRDYRLEWHCPHGVGHTIWAYQKRDVQSDYVHGCCQDSCCSKLKIRGLKKCTKKAKN